MIRTFGLAAALLVGLSACGTIGDLMGRGDECFDSSGPHVFGGVRLDAHEGRYWGGHDWYISCCRWLFMPLSLALDTALLPLTLPLSLIEEGRAYITVTRKECDEAILRRQESHSDAELRYLGSEEGFHHFRIGRGSTVTPRYRIHQSELTLSAPFPYTRDPKRWVSMMFLSDR